MTLSNSSDVHLAPFVKWVGGKRQLIKHIKPILPESMNTYYEPFVGGGAVLFNHRPNVAVINDFNHELINVYDTIKDNVYELIEDLKTHIYDSDYFYQNRERGLHPI